MGELHPGAQSTKQSVAEYVNGVESNGEQKFFSNRKDYFNNKSSSVHKVTALAGGHRRNDSNLFTQARRYEDQNVTQNHSISTISGQGKHDKSGLNNRSSGVNNTFTTWGIGTS